MGGAVAALIGAMAFGIMNLKVLQPGRTADEAITAPSATEISEETEELRSGSDDTAGMGEVTIDNSGESDSLKIPEENGITTTRVNFEELPEDTMISGIDSCYPRIDPREVINDSSLIVYGEVIHISEAFKAVYPDGRGEIVTEVTMSVKRTYRGDPVDTVKFRIRGGYADGICEEYNDSPIVSLGEEWLFFLNKEYGAWGFSALGDDYRLTQYSSGAYRLMDVFYMR